LSLCVGWIRGGSLRNLATASFRLPWLPLLGILVQLLIFDPFSHLLPLRLPVALLHLLSYGLVAAFVWANRRLPEMALVAAGLASNALAILANGGFMPASEEALRTAGRWTPAREAGTVNNSSVMGPHTRLWWLGDIFAIPAGLPFANVFSIGDVLLGLGILMLVPALMGARPLRSEHRLAAGVAAGFLIGYLVGSVRAPAAHPAKTLHPAVAQPASVAPALPTTEPTPTLPLPPRPAPEVRRWYVVQVGAFRNRTNAVALVKRLAKDGYSGQVVSGRLHRVFVGEFETEEAAHRLAAVLAQSGYRAFVRTVSAPGPAPGR